MKRSTSSGPCSAPLLVALVLAVTRHDYKIALALRKRSSSWNILVQQADGMTQRRFPCGQFSFLRHGLVGGGLVQVGRGLQGRPYPVGAIGIPLFDHPHQRPFRLAEPVLQIASGPADLAAHQVSGRTAQVFSGRPPAELAGQPAAHRAGQQLGLADVLDAWVPQLSGLSRRWMGR